VGTVLADVVSQAVFRARQIERAVNDPGPWTITFGTQIAPVVRWVGEDRVIFRAHFPNACWLAVSAPVLTLHCREKMVAVKSIDVPNDGEFIVEWDFAVSEPVRV
jgi:hypothetical protein